MKVRIMLVLILLLCTTLNASAMVGSASVSISTSQMISDTNNVTFNEPVDYTFLGLVKAVVFWVILLLVIIYLFNAWMYM